MTQAAPDGETPSQRHLRSRQEVDAEVIALRRSLIIRPLADVAADVDAALDPGWLWEPVWPADAYGMISAENKAGKTWAVLDAAVSVASGTPWLGTYDCAAPGPVLVFLGEGGARKMVRRLRAVADAAGVEIEKLPIDLCLRVPQLSSADHVAQVAEHLASHPTRLVIIDPFYLAAKGAKSSDLIDIGGHLEPIQRACQDAGSALMVVHHWNKTGEGKGKGRMSGAGMAEWGRVLGSAHVEKRTTDPDTAESVVTLAWEFVGDEIPDIELRTVRRVRADKPADLRSPLHYAIEPAAPPTSSAEPWSGPTQCADAVYDLVSGLTEPISQNQIGKRLRELGKSYRDKTVADAASLLVADGRLFTYDGPRKARMYRLPKDGDDGLF